MDLRTALRGDRANQRLSRRSAPASVEVGQTLFISGRHLRSIVFVFGLLAGVFAGCGGGGATTSFDHFPPPQPDFSISFSSSSLNVAQGATSSSVSLSITPANGFSGSVQVALSGLPSGISSSPASPFPVSAGSGADVLFGASPSAAAGNFTITAQGTSGSLTHTANLALTVQNGTASALSGTAFITTGSTPSADDPANEPHHHHLVCDSANKHLFVANRAMNRVEVLSSSDGSPVEQIAIPGASSVDISTDGKTVWVGTVTQQILAIDASSLAIRQALSVNPLQPLPNVTFDRPEEILALSDGKLLIRLREAAASESLLALFDPANGSMTNLTSSAPTLFQSGVGIMARSGDHTRVLVSSNDSSGEVALFDSNGGLVAGPVALGSGSVTALSVNQDGSHFAAAVTVGTTTQIDLLGQTLNVLSSYDAAQSHGLVFSRDGQRVYVSESKNGAPEITVLSTANLSVTGEIPDPQVQAKPTEIEDADDGHILYGVGNRGIALIDAGHPLALPSTFPSFSQVPVSQPDGGPNSGGTVVQLAGKNLEMNPQIKFGTQLSSSVQSGATQIQAASPPNTAVGPVSLTAFFPSGWLAVAPAAFSYGPEIREILPNAGNKTGGESIAIYGFGFGSDPSKVTVSIGGASANVQKLETLPVVADSLGLDPSFPLPIERLTVLTPSGTPSNADVSVTAPSGKCTLPHAFQFLQSEQVFAKAGFYKFLSYDQKRQWIYMSNIDHLDVFDLAASQFRGGIQPPGGPPPNAQLRASTLTPDGSQLVVADFGAQSVYLINPDTASGNGISVGGVPGFVNSGPARVAVTDNSTVFVGLAAEGSSNGCVTCLGQLDLTANPVTIQPAPQPQLSLLTGAPFLASDLVGSRVFFSFEAAPGGPLASWDSSNPSQFATLPANANTSDLAVAADGNFIATRTVGGLEIRSSGLGLMGSLATPELERIPLRTEVPGIALHPSGALVYEPFLTGPAPASLPITGIQGGVDIVDSHTGRLRLRIMLPEPLAALAADSDGLRADFLAIDENGQRIFTLTASGLTVVQLSSVPLSIGSISPATAPGGGGTTLTIRGSGFQSGTKVTIGGKSASANFQDMNTLTVLTPSLPSGAQQVAVANPDGETYSLDAAFTAQ